MATAKTNAAPAPKSKPIKSTVKEVELDKDFASAMDAAFGARNKGENTWSDLLKYVLKSAHFHFDQEAAKAEFKAEEAAYAKARKRKITGLTAYRTAKSTILKAVGYGIHLWTSDNKPKTKDTIRDEIKEKEGTPSNLTKFQTAITRASNIADNMVGGNALLSAWNMAKDLADKLGEEYKSVEKKAKERKKEKESKAEGAAGTVH